MIRKLIVNALYEYAKAVSYLADRLSPPCDNIWRSRQWKQWNGQRPYQRYMPPERCVQHAAKP